MKSLYPLEGIVTVLNTPFTESGEVALEDLRSNVEEALKAGVNGFLVPAMASEVNKLTIEERINMVEVVMATAEKKIPVFAGTSAKKLKTSKKLLEAYLSLGCEHVLFQIPYKNEDQFLSNFKDLASMGPEVIMLQDWDSSGYGLSETLIVKLFKEIPSFRCLKVETNPAGPKYSRILDLTDNKLNVSGGWAVTQMIEGLKRGVHAFMPTGMHYIYTEIYKKYQSGDIDKSQELFKRILPVLAFSNQHLDISIHFFKNLLYEQGIYKTPNVRDPIIDFDKIHRDISKELINEIIQIESNIKSKRAQ